MTQSMRRCLKVVTLLILFLVHLTDPRVQDSALGQEPQIDKFDIERFSVEFGMLSEEEEMMRNMGMEIEVPDSTIDFAVIYEFSNPGAVFDDFDEGTLLVQETETMTQIDDQSSNEKSGTLIGTGVLATRDDFAFDFDFKVWSPTGASVETHTYAYASKPQGFGDGSVSIVDSRIRTHGVLHLLDVNVQWTVGDPFPAPQIDIGSFEDGYFSGDQIELAHFSPGANTSGFRWIRNIELNNAVPGDFYTVMVGFHDFETESSEFIQYDCPPVPEE